MFESQQIKTGEYAEEKINIKNNNEKITLFIDYVEFADGSSWGKNIHRTSERITQEFAGRKAAIDYFNGIIKNKEQASLTNALETDILDYQVPYPDATLNENERRGFRAGYKSVVSILQENKDQNNEKLLEKLKELERVILNEVKEK